MLLQLQEQLVETQECFVILRHLLEHQILVMVEPVVIIVHLTVALAVKES